MNILKKIITSPLKLIAFTTLILDFAALDDITTGLEPSKWKEWDFLLYSLIFFGILIYSRVNRNNRNS